MMRKSSALISFIVCLSLILAACGRKESVEEEAPFLYYINGDGTGLVRGEYIIGDGTAKEEVGKMLEALQEKPEDIERNSAIPEFVEVTETSLVEKRLTLNLSLEYEDLDAVQKALMQAAVVQSLVQIDGVDLVSFSVNGEPIRDANGNPVGFQNADDFVQNVGSTLHSYQSAELQLYFTNESGDKLVKETVNVKYSSNVSVEKLIVEQLIKGPSRLGSYPTINPETKVINVTSKEGICYVNLDEAFLESTYDVVPAVTVYSLVNSIVDGTGAGQVQISINGETKVTYMDTVDLSQPLIRNEEILEQTNK